MNDLINIFGDFTLKSVENEYINYEYFNFFKNPNKLPINNIFLERVPHVLDKRTMNEWKLVRKHPEKYVSTKKEVIPALDGSWLPEFIPTFEYYQYNFDLQEDNAWFIENNKNYILFLEYLIRCSYHQFWCSVLFREEVQNSLRDFLLCPIPLFLYKELEEECQEVYKSVFNAFYMVLRRLFFFKESETEYMHKELGAKYLIDRNLLNLRLASTITFLYQDFDNELIDEIGEVYFTIKEQEKFIQMEVEQLLKHSIVVFDMIKGKITGKFDPGINVVPISLEGRPKIFSLIWVETVINYCLNMICTLSALFRLRKSNIKDALSLNLPEILAKNYEIIFNELYDLLEDREELKKEDDLSKRVINKIGYARYKFIDTFHYFVTYLLDQTISSQGDSGTQQEHLEVFIDLMTVALEHEIFICDYDHKYSISQTVETLEDFSVIDQTRAQYIITSLNNLERKDYIKAKYSIESAFVSQIPKSVPVTQIPSCSNEIPGTSSQESDLENKIKTILGIFPHLGDGFVLKCLEHYDYNSDQVVQAILEENLPPHICDISFDLPNIPPEPVPTQPILAYRGKKPGFTDALAMLNDKAEKEKMKTLVLEGIKYNTRYDNTEDEYDDRDVLLEPDFVVEHDVDKYEKSNLNQEDVVSDISYSDNEFDDDGKPVENTNKTSFKPFCEDPALVRARYEAKFGSRRGRGNVVGKPKVQGQDKNVVQARDKKNTQKSSRANHNRKGGSQFKRNKGMIPS